MNVLKAQRLDEATVIYVTTDHGFDPGARTHKETPDARLAPNDPAVKTGGTLADTPATILQRFGVPLDDLNSKLIGRPLTGAGDAVGFTVHICSAYCFASRCARNSRTRLRRAGSAGWRWAMDTKSAIRWRARSTRAGPIGFRSQ